MTIEKLIHSYKNSLDYLDIELLIAHSLGKTREFVLTHPEYELSADKFSIIKDLIKRRIKHEPIAYLTGHKEFYGLEFIVNKNTLIPRPETEMMVEQTLDLLNNQFHDKTMVIDVGTGSGCIITSIAHNIYYETSDTKQRRNIEFFGSDISKDALLIAKKNAKANGLNKKIKFLNGSMLDPFIRNSKFEIRNSRMIILANLPYLSKEIFSSSPIDVKKYEPKSALYSPKEGLKHYQDLLLQIQELKKKHSNISITCLMEISPEQKKKLSQIIKKLFLSAKILFIKDLAKKWRICKIIVSTN
jgi:release factor glutamine methyltransferase